MSPLVTYESGIPPARERLTRSSSSEAALDQLEAALVESTRAEANLGLLVRGLKHLAAGASAAQEANSVLVQELEALRGRLGRLYESEMVLQQRVQTLESALDSARRERESWLVQEDAFLAALLDEHEQKLFEVERQHERKLAELDLAFDELRRQHELARTDVGRLTYERDAAVALLSEPSPHTERAVEPSLMASSAAVGVRLGSVRLTRSETPRPSGGYSMASGELVDEAEHQGHSHITERPPRL